MEAETNEDEKQENKWWNGLVIQLMVFLGQLFFMFVLTGIVLYIATQYKLVNSQPFELATVVGMLGGFPLVAGINEKANKKLSSRLKTIGGLYLFSAIMFVVFGFYLAADQAQLIKSDSKGAWIFIAIYSITLFGGAIAFIGGMWLTLGIIPQLVGLGSFVDRVKKIFKKTDKGIHSLPVNK
jgi:hypothetical protein